MTRRLKIVSLDPHFLIDVLNWAASGNMAEIIGVPVCQEIPADAEVLSVTANWSTRRIEAMVTHSTFAEVAEGAIPPIIPSTYETRIVERV